MVKIKFPFKIIFPHYSAFEILTFLITISALLCSIFLSFHWLWFLVSFLMGNLIKINVERYGRINPPPEEGGEKVEKF